MKSYEKKYEIQLHYGNHGIPYIEPDPKAKLNAEKHGNTYTIKGNTEGLLLLARSLVSLAIMDEISENKEYHIHIDDLYNINHENTEFIIRKEN